MEGECENYDPSNNVRTAFINKIITAKWGIADCSYA